MPRWAHNTLTPSVREVIIAALREGAMLKDAAAAAGVPLRTVHRWRSTGRNGQGAVYRQFWLDTEAAHLQGQMRSAGAATHSGARFAAAPMEQRAPTDGTQPCPTLVLLGDVPPIFEPPDDAGDEAEQARRYGPLLALAGR